MHLRSSETIEVKNYFFGWKVICLAVSSLLAIAWSIMVYKYWYPKREKKGPESKIPAKDC